MTTEDKFLVGCALGSLLMFLIQDWLAERRGHRIEKEGIDKWLAR